MTKIVGNQHFKTFRLYVKKTNENDWKPRAKSPDYGFIDDQAMKFKKQGFETKIITSESHRVTH